MLNTAHRRAAKIPEKTFNDESKSMIPHQVQVLLEKSCSGSPRSPPRLDISGDRQGRNTELRRGPDWSLERFTLKSSRVPLQGEVSL